MYVLGTLNVATTSVGLTGGVSLVSIQQAGVWATFSTLNRYWFSTYVTNSDRHWDFSQGVSLGLVSRKFVGVSHL